MNFSGRSVDDASRVIEIDEVLVPTMASGLSDGQRLPKICRLTSSFSVAASTKGPAASPGAASLGEVWICSVTREVPIQIGRGENRGQKVTYHNVVRTLLKVGDWNGSAGSWTVPLENISREGIDAAVVFVQRGSRDKPGAMLGAAYTSLH